MSEMDSLVVALRNLRKEYDNAMLNENLDSYDDLLDAVKSVLIEAGFPPLIHDEKAVRMDLTSSPP